MSFQLASVGFAYRAIRGVATIDDHVAARSANTLEGFVSEGGGPSFSGSVKQIGLPNARAAT